MSTRRARRNHRPALLLALSLIGFAAAIATGSAAVALLSSLAILGALLSVERYPRNRA